MAILNRKTKAEVAFDITNYILLGLFALVVIYPLVFTISASFSDPRAVTTGQLVLFPISPTLDSYKEVFRNSDILLGYRNTILVTFGGTILNLFMTILGAYPLSRKDLYGRNVLMMLFTFTMFFGGGIIPFYLTVQQLHLLNTWWSLVLPVALSTYNLIIMRTYFDSSIPYELQEAAFIDGCSNIRILIKIVLPLSGPILAVLALYYAVGHWNSYFNAMLFINDRKMYPLQLFLREILVMNQAQAMQDAAAAEMAKQAMRAETIKYSVIVVSSVPMLLVYPLIQKFFVKGVMIGAVKG